MNKSKIFLTVLYLVLIGGFVYLAITSKGFGLLGKKEKTAQKGEWQAVFLSNGQVYFGKLEGLSGNFVKLEEIYYLQLAQAPQPSEKKDEKQQPQVSLVKLGNELHGPEDRMTINRNQILFVEDMKPESKVVQAIDRYKQQGPDQTPTQQQPQTQQQQNQSPTQPSNQSQTQTGETKTQE